MEVKYTTHFCMIYGLVKKPSTLLSPLPIPSAPAIYGFGICIDLLVIKHPLITNSPNTG